MSFASPLTVGVSGREDGVGVDERTGVASRGGRSSSVERELVFLWCDDIDFADGGRDTFGGVAGVFFLRENQPRFLGSSSSRTTILSPSKSGSYSAGALRSDELETRIYITTENTYHWLVEVVRGDGKPKLIQDERHERAIAHVPRNLISHVYVL